MNMRLLALIAALTLAGRTVRAENLNLNETPDTVVTSLSPYSFGLGAGVMTSVNDELVDESPAFMKLSFIQSLDFAKHFNAGLNLNWMAPGQNWGGELNLNYLLVSGNFRPFIGVGGGIQYFDRDGVDFGHSIGVSRTVQAGMFLDVLDELQFRINVPYTFVDNSFGDRGVGVEFGLLFSSPHRKTKVKKLIY